MPDRGRRRQAVDIESVEVEPSPEHRTDFVADDDAYTGHIRVFADSTLRTQLVEPPTDDPAHQTALVTVMVCAATERSGG